MADESTFCSITEAARRSGFATCYIRSRVRRGEIPGVQIGRKFEVNFPQLMRQLEQESMGGVRNGEN